MERKAKIFVAGHSGLIGSAVSEKLQKDGYHNVITRPRRELDLTRQAEVEKFFRVERVEYVVLCAARVGGIKANISHPAQFIFENLAIQNNVIHSAYLSKVKKLLFFGSACSYPAQCRQPMREEYLLSGQLEPTNEPYAVAKISGIKMCQAYNRQYRTHFISVMLTNAYGPYDNFDMDDAHVVPALIRRFHEAKTRHKDSVTVWGSGDCRREFIYAEDAADGALFLMGNYEGSEIINLGVGYDISIRELAEIIRKTVGYKGRVRFDTSKPDGIKQKLLDISRLKTLAWKPRVSLEEGITKTYDWFLKKVT